MYNDFPCVFLSILLRLLGVLFAVCAATVFTFGLGLRFGLGFGLGLLRCSFEPFALS